MGTIIISTTFVGFVCMRFYHLLTFKQKQLRQAWRSPDWFHRNGHQNAIHGIYWIKIARLEMCRKVFWPCQHCFNTQDAVKKKAVDHSSSNHLSKSSIWLYIIPCCFSEKKRVAVKTESSTNSKSYLTLQFFEFFGTLTNRVFSKTRMIRRSTSSSVECSSDLFAKPRSLRKEWCGFMGDVFFSPFLQEGKWLFFVAFLLTNVDVPTVKCKSVFEYWCQWLGMIWGAGSNWNSIEIDTSIHMPFLHDIWMIRKRKKTLATDEWMVVFMPSLDSYNERNDFSSSNSNCQAPQRYQVNWSVDLSKFIRVLPCGFVPFL